VIGRWHWAIPTLGVTMIFFSPLLFNQLVVSKIVKIVAARCSILRQKCTKFDFVWRSAPDPAELPQTPWLDLGGRGGRKENGLYGIWYIWYVK